jgi:hydrogenase-4 component E
MDTFLHLILLLIILLNFLALGISRLGACIRVVAMQGALISLLPPIISGFSLHTLALALGAFLLKGMVIPWLLFRAIRQVKIRREVEPRIGYIPTLMLGTLTTAAATLFGDMLPLLVQHVHSLTVPCSLATLAAGFLMLITRKKAITQVLGYLMFENGIFVFGMLLADAMPLMVEAGVLLDVLVAIFVMGIVMNHINREFSSIGTEKLTLLKE